MTKKIQLTKGKFALVDDADFEWLSQYNWCIQGEYAARAKNKKRGETGGKLTVSMHRFVMGLGDSDGIVFVDHINRDKLDNRRSNLRLCSRKQNLTNQRKGNRFGYKGIVKESCGKYQAMIWDGKKNIHLGCFPSKEEAALAYDKAAKEMHGAFAWLNFP